MLATRCPACGDANAVCLATPDAYDCAACRYAGPPAEGDRPAIEEAARVVASMDERTLQMSGLQRDLLASATFGRATLLLALGTLLVPAVLTTGFVESLLAGEGGGAGLVAAPGVTLLVGAVVGVLVVRARQRRLIEHCTADPPRGRGEIGRCHACGASIDAPSGGVVARCRFCRVDNVVDGDAMRRTLRRHDLAANGFARTLERKQRSVGSVTRHAALGVIVAALLVDVWVIDRALTELNRRRALSDAMATLSVFATDAGRCVGRRSSSGAGGPEYDFGDRRPLGDGRVRRTGPLRRVDLEGQRVVAGSRRGVIRGVALDQGRVVIRVDDGAEERVADVVGACLGE